MVLVLYVKGELILDNKADIIKPFQSFKKNVNNEIFIWLNIQPCKNDFLPFIQEKVRLAIMPH